MKKAITSILLVFTVAVSAVMLSACAPDVFDETDLYGSFITEDNARSLTLADENAAVVCYGEKYEEYYARYDFIKSLVELRNGGFRGDIAYTFNIVDANTLELVFSPEEIDADGATTSKEEKLTFTRDKSYDPAI